jgi:hypothetical protein
MTQNNSIAVWILTIACGISIHKTIAGTTLLVLETGTGFIMSKCIMCHVSDNEVKVVIAKYQWLKNWQNRQPDQSPLKANSSYCWISSARVALTKNSRFTRSLAQAGLDYPKKTVRIV